MACSSKTKICNLKEILNGEFEMKYIEESKRVMGMDIMRSHKNGELFLSQSSYLKKVMEHFRMQDV